MGNTVEETGLVIEDSFQFQMSNRDSRIDSWICKSEISY
jgi:hypothetical protein